MKKITSIKELENRSISPIENENFIDLVFRVNYPTTAGTNFSNQFDYNLNSKNKDINYYWKVSYNFMVLKSKIFYRNLIMMSDEQITKIGSNLPKDELLTYFEKLQNMSYEEYSNIIDNGDISIFDTYKQLVDKDLFSNGWSYFRSHKVAPNRAEQIHKSNIKHRLYLTMDVSELYKFAYQLACELENKNFPYSFKYLLRSNMNISQNDTLVIYLDSDKRLIEYINLINEMIDSNKGYQDNIHEPSAHMWNIDGRIGYGFEPKTHCSYSEAIGHITTQVRNECCEKITTNAINSIQSNRRAIVFYGDVDEYIKALKEKRTTELIRRKILDERKQGHSDFRELFGETFYTRFSQEVNKQYGIDIESIFDDEQQR